MQQIRCPAPGDDATWLDVAARLITRPLRLDRPLWAASFVTGLAGGRVALVVVVQHALADGISGLAVLGALVDGAPASEPAQGPAFPTPAPTAGVLAVDALRSRLRVIMSLPGRIRDAAGAHSARPFGGSSLGQPEARIGRATPCSLLQPTGARRQVAVTRVRLTEIHAVAHEHDATVNDLLLTAIGGALHSTLREHGERVPAVLVAIPVAERRSATAQTLGNRFREVRAAIPDVSEPPERLERVAAIMRVRKRSPMGPSVSLIASAFVRAAMTLHIYGWCMRRQRYLHTVVTDLHGPDTPRTYCGAPIVEIVPLAVGGGGNVAVTFAALSYAGTLEVSVTADPDCLPDLVHITTTLQAELDQLARLSPEAAAPPPR